MYFLFCVLILSHDLCQNFKNRFGSYITLFATSNALHCDNRFSVQPSPQTRRSSSPSFVSNLPGPSQVITHPGQSGTNSVTGERQRRRGVSGPPSGIIILRRTIYCIIVIYIKWEVHDKFITLKYL